MTNNHETINNYQLWCEQWRERFLKMDQKELQNRLPELQVDEQYLSIVHFGHRFFIDRISGEITLSDGTSISDTTALQNQVSCSEKLNIYTLFGYVSENAVFQDNWVKFEKLKGMSPFAPAFQEGVVRPFARMFDGKVEKLREAFQKLGAKELSWSDAGYEFSAFACIPVRFLFWESDEEFPAQANLLFDASATDFIHGESIVTIATIGLARIAEAAGVEMDCGAFQVMY